MHIIRQKVQYHDQKQDRKDDLPLLHIFTSLIMLGQFQVLWLREQLRHHLQSS